MSTSDTNERRMAVLLFDLVERDDLLLHRHLEAFGFKSKFVGITSGRGITYQFTPRIEGEDVRQEADIDLEEASEFGRFDVLVIPGGPGALGLEDAVVQRIGKLADSAQWVVAFSLGANLLASSGRLDGKEATTHHGWAFGDFLEQWPAVKWKPKTALVHDGKYFTAYTIPKSKNVEKVAGALVSAMGFDSLKEHAEDSSRIDFNPSISEDSEDTLRWSSVLERLHRVAQQKVSTGGVDVDQDVLDADPFIRPPATDAQIRDAETRLGIALPADYKAFLRTADGTGFSGCTDIPGLIRAADLQWGNADEMGLEELRLELTADGSTNISATLPFERVLGISDPDEDELVCLVEPAFVTHAKREMRSDSDEQQEATVSDWVLFRFVPWAACYEQFDSFTAYMERIV